jgi:hypothetical protein
MGTQRISKFHEHAFRANDVSIFVAVFRFTDVMTDIVVSLNSPYRLSVSSSSAQSVDAGQTGILNDPQIAEATFMRILSTFNVSDFSLFQNE